MPDDTVEESEYTGASSEVPESPLPKASDELARKELSPTPKLELADDEHKWRYDEALVRERETQAQQANDDRKMRKEIAERVFKAISVQIVIADVVFLIYGTCNDWHIPVGAINAWLGAVVIQVIAVGFVIVSSLFPSDRKRSNPRSLVT